MAYKNVSLACWTWQRWTLHASMAAEIRTTVIAGRKILDVRATHHAMQLFQAEGCAAIVRKNAQQPWTAVLSVHRFMMVRARIIAAAMVQAYVQLLIDRLYDKACLALARASI